MQSYNSSLLIFITEVCFSSYKLEKVRREANKLAKMSHTRVVNYHGVWAEALNGEIKFIYFLNKIRSINGHDHINFIRHFPAMGLGEVD